MIKGLYIHIPFCKSICTYCDFAKLVGSASLQEEYMVALEKELLFHREQLDSLQTIYIGGGTPSSISISLMRAFLTMLKQVVDLPSLEEFTIEANPQDVTHEWIELIKEFHVTRVSVGVQSFNDSLLLSIGRTHTSKQALEAIELLKKENTFSLSIDLIYSLPNETLQNLKSDLDTALSLEIDHLSIYSLILEEKTLLYHQVHQLELEMPSEEEEERMALWIQSRIHLSPYVHYEISNYGLVGHFSKHNLLYWNMDDYLGIGLGAASMIENRRTTNLKTIRKYIESVNENSNGIDTSEPVDEIQETILLGLRKAEGISKSGFLKKFGQTPFERYPGLIQHLHNGLLKESGDRVHLTEKGFLLSNQVFIELF